ncbi:MAG: AbrB/MazE/SpoVT family DNA-binding domain-containing protein [Ginsengibacter sp.]
MQTNLKKIGNSFGVILNKKLLSQAGISNSSDIIIEARDNAIVILPVTGRRPLNRDLSTWRKQIKAAIKQGQTPEKSVWGNRLTEKEEKEWT